jgi:hypothetical protein
MPLSVFGDRVAESRRSDRLRAVQSPLVGGRVPVGGLQVNAGLGTRKRSVTKGPRGAFNRLQTDKMASCVW